MNNTPVSWHESKSSMRPTWVLLGSSGEKKKPVLAMVDFLEKFNRWGWIVFSPSVDKGMKFPAVFSFGVAGSLELAKAEVQISRNGI